MADLSLVVKALGDVLRSADLTDSNRETLKWAIGELQTPPGGGPWQSKGSQILDGDGFVLATLPATIGDMQDGANRRLILAAPRLLDAAQRAIKELTPGATIQPHHADDIRGILQKAVYLALHGTDPDAKRAENA